MDPTPGTTRLYVYNLPYAFQRSHVESLFRSVEPFDIVVPVSQQPNRLSCGYAFITVQDSNLQAALAFDGTEDQHFGRVIKVEIARPRRARTAPAT